MNDHTPIRKLGRGIANILYSVTEIPETMLQVNDREGTAAMWSYGVVNGVRRTVHRIGYGVYDFVTFPFPTYRGSYRPPFKSNIPWIHSGFSEFPPELGNASRKQYVEFKHGY